MAFSIASSGLCNFRSFYNHISDYPEAIACADFDQVTIWGIYFPRKKKHTFFEFMLSQFGVRKDILMGDFNTGKNYIDQKGDSFWYSDQLERLEDKGYHDAFRHLHGNIKDIVGTVRKKMVSDMIIYGSVRHCFQKLKNAIIHNWSGKKKYLITPK